MPWLWSSAGRTLSLSVLFSLVVAFSLAGCGRGDKSFDKVRASEAPFWNLEGGIPSAGLPVDSSQLALRLRWDSLFSRDTLPMSAYGHLVEAIHVATEKGLLGILFESFFQSPAIRNLEARSPSSQKLISLWVEDALASTDFLIRRAYESHLSRIRRGEGAIFKLEKDHVHPGSSVRLQNLNAMAADAQHNFTLRIDRLAWDSTRQFRDPEPLVHKAWRPARGLVFTPPREGVYRITISSSHFFQQLYLQSSNIDPVIKADDSTLLIWAASSLDSAQPPYRIHLWDPSGAYQEVQTDSTGFLRLRRPIRAKESLELQVLIEKAGHRAFTSIRFPSLGPKEHEFLSILYSHPRTILPGGTVHFQGILRRFEDERILRAPKSDSVHVQIMDPLGRGIQEAILPLDDWGHFGDSLKMDSIAMEGEYQIHTRSLKRMGRQLAHRSSYSGFHVLAAAKGRSPFELDPQKKHWLAGDTIRVMAKGMSVFDKSTMVSLRVQWSIRKLEKAPHATPVLGEAFAFHPTGPATVLFEQELQANGRDAVELFCPPESLSSIQFPTELSISISSVTPFATKPITARVIVLPHRLLVHARTDSPVLQVDSQTIVLITASDFRNVPLEGPLQYEALHGDSSTYRDTTSFSNGKAEIRFRPSSTGHWTLKFEIAREHLPNRTSSLDLHVVSSGDWGVLDENLSANWNESEYGFGDTARLEALLPIEEHPIMLTEEGHSLGESWHVIPAAPKFSFPYPVRKKRGYNQSVGITRHGKAGMGLVHVRLPVTDNSALLQVKYTGPREFKPGTELIAKIRILDSSSRPVKAAFSVALQPMSGSSLSDSMVLESELLSIFPPSFGNRVRTRVGGVSFTSLLAMASLKAVKYREQGYRLIWKRGIALIPEAPRPAESGFRNDPSSIVDNVLSRKRIAGNEAWPEHPEMQGYWMPQVVTDETGGYSLRFTMPPTEGTWLLQLRGSNGDSKLVEHRVLLKTLR